MKRVIVARRIVMMPVWSAMRASGRAFEFATEESTGAMAAVIEGFDGVWYRAL